MRRRCWRMRGFANECPNATAEQFSVFSWSAGAYFWSQHELRAAGSMQLKMCSRILKLWPRATEEMPGDMRHMPRWSGVVLTTTQIPRWDSALLACLVAMGGSHSGPCESRGRWLRRAIERRDASYGQTTRGRLSEAHFGSRHFLAFVRPARTSLACFGMEPCGCCGLVGAAYMSSLLLATGHLQVHVGGVAQVARHLRHARRIGTRTA